MRNLRVRELLTKLESAEEADVAAGVGTVNIEWYYLRPRSRMLQDQRETLTVPILLHETRPLPTVAVVANYSILEVSNDRH